MLLNYTNIEFMLRHFCIPLEFTNLETDLKYKIEEAMVQFKTVLCSSDSLKLVNLGIKFLFPCTLLMIHL